MISDTYSHQGALNWPESTFGYVTPTPSPALSPAAVPVTSPEFLNWIKSCCLPGPPLVCFVFSLRHLLSVSQDRNQEMRETSYKELKHVCTFSSLQKTLLPLLYISAPLRKARKTNTQTLTGEKGILVKGAEVAKNNFPWGSRPCGESF